jgi:hypothetical protein
MRILLPFAAAVLAFSTPATASTLLDFNDVSPLDQCVANGGSFNYGGLTFTAGPTNICTGVWNNGPSGGADNGTPALIYGFGSVTITATDGGLFEILSFDAGLSWYTALTTHTLTATGVLADDSTIPGSAAITKTYTNISAAGTILKSLTFDGIDDGYITFDNFNVNFVGGAVPEPATWAMMIAGFGLIGVAARRQRRAITS